MLLMHIVESWSNMVYQDDAGHNVPMNGRFR